MSQNLAPPPGGPAKVRSRRGFAPWLSEDPEKRSVQVGVAGTVLIHLLLLLFMPGYFAAKHATPPRPRAARKFNIQIVPSPVKLVPAKPRMKYVEANPNAPESIPDHTNNVSDRNQRVAQEKPNPNRHSDMPTTQGRKDIQAVQIVDGRLTKPEEAAPVPIPAQARLAKAPTQRKEQNPRAGIDKTQGTDAKGFASNIGKRVNNQANVPEPITGGAQGPLVGSFSTGMPQIDPRHPQPRRTLELHVRPAVFAENKFGTENVGVTALDSRWSNYGVYMKRMSEIVQTEWDRILAEGAINQSGGSSVSVRFIMNSKGEIARILGVEVSDGISDEAKAACVSGITNRAPYGVWTEDMISVLGDQQELTFTFFYQ